MNAPLLSPEDVAALCGLSRKAVYRAIERGELQASRLCSRLRIRPEDVESWLADYPRGGAVSLTELGRQAAVAVDVPQTSAEMQAFVYSLVGGAKTRLLEVLVPTYPNALRKEDLAEQAGASSTSSSFTNNLGSLRSLGLIDYPTPGWVAVEPILFLEGEQ